MVISVTVAFIDLWLKYETEWENAVVNSHLIIFACHCNIHDDEIFININFRVGNWTSQSQEKYFRQNLIHTLVFEFILWTLKGTMDYSNSCYNTTQVAYCTVINQYIQYQNEISKHLKVIYMLQALDLCHQDKLLLTLINPVTPKISFVILLTVCHTVFVMLVWRIWYWINL